jgi:hypothetical protein
MVLMGAFMRVLVRTIMAASLIMADAAQAASLTATQGGQQAETQVTPYEARLKNILDRDEKSWKRLSASICAGCGAPPPPLEIANATPSYVRAQREAAAAPPPPATTASKHAARPASVQSAALREYEGARTRVVRSSSTHVRLTAKARRYARYARLRLIRHQRRLALLQAQRRHALLAARAQQTAHRVRVAGLGLGGSEREEARFGDERRPVPLPPERPDMLCADDRGVATTGFRPSSACVSPR